MASTCVSLQHVRRFLASITSQGANQHVISRFQHVDCDLLVIGGGAAGLSAAVTAAYHGLKVIIAEKAETLGGATAWSGGWMWAPLNPLSQADGIVEDIEAPRTYLKHALGENYDEPRVEALLQNARHMVAFFENKTSLQFVSGSGSPTSRVTCPEPARAAGRSDRNRSTSAGSGRICGKLVRPQLYETSFLGMGIMAGPDLQAFLHTMTSVKSFFHAAWRVAFHVLDLITYRRGMQLVNGPALIARLVKSADEVGVQMWPSSPATSLTTQDGRVTGAVIHRPTVRSPCGRRKGCCSPPVGSRTTSNGGPSSFPALPPARSTGRWRRRRPPVTG